jgi:hypothetical protein
MEIKRERLRGIIREELLRMIKEAGEDKKPDVADAEQDSKGKDSKKPADASASKVSAAPAKAPAKDAASAKDAAPTKDAVPNELPVDDEPADAELEKDVNDPESESEEEVTGGKIADKVTGKTIQSISMEPKSKIVPGAKEIVLTFDQITDPLRVLVMKTGEVKFYFRGLHNEL